MSDQLAISAAFSVLMMSVLVLFGPEPAPATLTADSVSATHTLIAPASIATQGRLPISFN